MGHSIWTICDQLRLSADKLYSKLVFLVRHEVTIYRPSVWNGMGYAKLQFGEDGVRAFRSQGKSH